MIIVMQISDEIDRDEIAAIVIVHTTNDEPNCAYVINTNMTEVGIEMIAEQLNIASFKLAKPASKDN